MLIKNKFEKTLLMLSSFMLVAITVLGVKMESDNKKLAVVEDALKAAVDNSSAANSQNLINQSRDLVMRQAANAPVPDTSTSAVVKTVIPGKTITQKVPVSSSSSSKTTSSKTTKTS